MESWNYSEVPISGTWKPRRRRRRRGDSHVAKEYTEGVAVNITTVAKSKLSRFGSFLRTRRRSRLWKKPSALILVESRTFMPKRRGLFFYRGRLRDARKEEVCWLRCFIVKPFRSEYDLRRVSNSDFSCFGTSYLYPLETYILSYDLCLDQEEAAYHLSIHVGRSFFLRMLEKYPSSKRAIPASGYK